MHQAAVATRHRASAPGVANAPTACTGPATAKTAAAPSAARRPNKVPVVAASSTVVTIIRASDRIRAPARPCRLPASAASGGYSTGAPGK